MSESVNAALRIVSALSDPIRFAAVSYLMSGPKTVSELVAATGAAQSKVSNHLAVLRQAGLVETERSGRYVAYALADPAIASVVEALENAAGTGPLEVQRVPEIAVARTCYDHVAGRLGVALFRSLVAQRAIRDVPAAPAARKVRSGLGEVALGRDAAAVFGALGIDLDDVAAARRQFATACSDWTETRPHLGGALGAALQHRLLRENWLQRRSGTRVLRITRPGRDGLRERFGIDVDTLAGPGARSASA